MIISYAAYDSYQQGFQVAIINGDKKMFVRRVYGGSINSTTGNWERLYSTMDKPTAEDVGAISKDGDTMTGNTLGINNGYGKVLSTTDLLQLSAYKSAGESSNSNHIQLMQGSSSLNSALRLVNYNANGTRTDHNVLHTGNLSANGVAKIESGSYVGTGTSGINHPTEITFSFVPKMVWVWERGSTPSGKDGSGYVFPCVGLTSSYSTIYTKPCLDDYVYQSKKARLNDKTFGFYCVDGELKYNDDGSSYYAYTREQLNDSGKTYDYMAIG